MIGRLGQTLFFSLFQVNDENDNMPEPGLPVYYVSVIENSHPDVPVVTVTVSVTLTDTNHVPQWQMPTVCCNKRHRPYFTYIFIIIKLSVSCHTQQFF